MPEPRRELANLPPAVHGAPDLAELHRLGLDPNEVIDFSVNTNPFGPSPRVREAVALVPLDRYPDREALSLRHALARSHGVAPERILAGNGATELIWLTALAFLRPGDQVLVLGPTFAEYARVAILLGGKVSARNACAEQRFALDPDPVLDDLDRLRPRVAFLCNPNNPTGAVIPVEAIAGWARRQPHTLFVVDEAYLEFAPGLESALSISQDNVLVLRSMTKDFALAGLRLGYAVGSQAVVDLLARARPPWSVNALAQAAGLAALRDKEHVTRTLAGLKHAKEKLVTAIAGLGLPVLPSAVHFFLVHVGDAAGFRRALLRHGILVRDGTSFGLPGHVRIATRRPEENDRLLAAMAVSAATQTRMGP